MTCFLIAFILYIAGVCVAWFALYFEARDSQHCALLDAWEAPEWMLHRYGCRVATGLCWLSWWAPLEKEVTA